MTVKAACLRGVKRAGAAAAEERVVTDPTVSAVDSEEVHELEADDLVEAEEELEAFRDESTGGHRGPRAR